MLSILSAQAKSYEEMQSCKCSEALGLSTWEALWGGLIGSSVIAVDEKMFDLGLKQSPIHLFMGCAYKRYISNSHSHICIHWLR